MRIKEKPRLTHHYIQFAHGKLNYEANYKNHKNHKKQKKRKRRRKKKLNFNKHSRIFI